MSDELKEMTIGDAIEQGEIVQIVPQNRFKSWALWVSVAGAIWTILNAFGLPEKWGIPETTFKTVVDAIGAILIMFGICNDPTDKENF